MTDIPNPGRTPQAWTGPISWVAQDLAPERSPSRADGWAAGDPALAGEGETDQEICWKCGRRVARVRLVCGHCRATPAPDWLKEAGFGRNRARIFLPDPRARAVVASVALMLPGLVRGLTARFGLAAGSIAGRDEARRAMAWTLGSELAALALIGLALAWLPRGAAPGRSSLGRRIGVWALTALAVVPAVALARAYLVGLESWLGPFRVDAAVAGVLGPTAPPVLLTFALLPALIEEPFYRGRLVDLFRPARGVHGSAWWTAGLFGLAHLDTPALLPLLVPMGAALGYLRLLGGGTALAIAARFALAAGLLTAAA